LLFRCCITVVGKSGEGYACHPHPAFEFIPMPITTGVRGSYWPSHAAGLTKPTDLQIYGIPREYDPASKAVDSGRVTTMLLKLPLLDHAEPIVASARLYALGLELIRERPELAYQILISAVETIANELLADFEPPEDDKVEHQRAVFKMARILGLKESNARRLATEA
jgi:hypothetical protein